MLIRRIEKMFPVSTIEVYQYRNNKFAIYLSKELKAMRSDLSEIEPIFNELIK